MLSKRDGCVFIHTIKRRIKKLLCYISALSLVLSMTGKVYGEENSYLGVHVKQIAAGVYHTIIIDDQGKVWSWGYNLNGELGDGEYFPDSVVIQPINHGARRYGVYVSTVSQSYTTPAAITVNTDYQVTGLENGQTYFFAVTAINEGGESGYSNEVSGMPKTLPAPPENVYATAGNKKATVSFDEPLDNGGRPIIKYIVTSYPDNMVVEGTKSPITVDALRNGIEYTFTVKAVSEVGESSESLPSNPVKPKGSSGGGSRGTSSGDTGKNQSESNKDLIPSNKDNNGQKIDVVIEINGKPVKNIAYAILRIQNAKRTAELIID